MVTISLSLNLGGGLPAEPMANKMRERREMKMCLKERYMSTGRPSMPGAEPGRPVVPASLPRVFRARSPAAADSSIINDSTACHTSWWASEEVGGLKEILAQYCATNVVHCEGSVCMRPLAHAERGWLRRWRKGRSFWCAAGWGIPCNGASAGDGSTSLMPCLQLTYVVWLVSLLPWPRCHLTCSFPSFRLGDFASSSV